ncbi:MAG: ABC transporter ATP-binding protein [Elusimicrobiales bacterium]
MIKISGLSFEYIRGIKVLNGLNFDFEGGRFYALCGPNGCGKTTFLKIISGIYKNYLGSVRIRKDNSYAELKLLNEVELSKLVSYVCGDTFFYFDFYVKDILLMGRRRFHSFFSFYSDEDIDLIYDVARAMRIEHLFNRRINELSNGERQMVLIAQAAVQKTSIILVDEPTSHLDIKHRIEILSMLKEMVINEKLTVIAVMHDLKAASYYFDQMLFMKNGSICLNFSSNEFYANIDKISSVYEITSDVIKRFL